MATCWFDERRKRHVVEWRDPRTQKLRRRYFRQKSVAHRLATSIERALDKWKAGDEVEYLQVAAGANANSRNTREAMIDGYVSSGKPDRAEKQTRTLRFRLTTALEAMRVDSPAEVTLEAATEFISTMAGSPKTVADYATMLRSFSRWLWRTERLPTDRLGGLLHGPTRVTQRPRRWVTREEQIKLMAAAPVRPVVQRRRAYPNATPESLEEKRQAGLRHQLIYAFLPATGMRIGELNRLTWAQVDLDACEVHFRPHLEGERTKGQRSHRAPRPELQVIPAWLGRELRARRERIAAERGGPVDPATQVLPVERHFVRDTLRTDAEYAGIALETRDGILDVHALGRTSCVSFLLGQGVDEILRNLYTRHRPPAGTQARHYARVDRAQLHKVAALFADPFAELTGRGVSALLSDSAIQDGSA